MLQIQLRHWVIALNSHWRIAIHPDEISQSWICSRSCTTSLYRTSWVIRQRTAYYAFIYSLVIFVGCLHINIYAQMVFEEFRDNTAIESITLVVIGANHTILVRIAERHSHWRFLTDASRHGNIMIHTKCRTVNLILPIGIAITHCYIIWHT